MPLTYHDDKSCRSDPYRLAWQIMKTDLDACFNCRHEMSTCREAVPYLGLPGTMLLDVNVRRCPNCGEYAVEIPRPDGLNRGLALEVTKKPGRLDGGEIRFLRMVLDSKAADLAKLLAASPVTVSRWEHDVQPINRLADAALRLLVESTLVTKGFDPGRIEQILRAERVMVPVARRGTRRIGAKQRAMRFEAKKWRPAELGAA